MEFKDRLRQLRDGKQLSAAQLAGQFDKSEGAVRMWETGKAKPDADTLIKLSQYFNCTTDYLLGREEFKNLQSFREYAKSVEGFGGELSHIGVDDGEALCGFIVTVLRNIRASSAESLAYADSHDELETFMLILRHYGDAMAALLAIQSAMKHKTDAGNEITKDNAVNLFGYYTQAVAHMDEAIESIKYTVYHHQNSILDWLNISNDVYTYISEVDETLLDTPTNTKDGAHDET